MAMYVVIMLVGMAGVGSPAFAQVAAAADPKAAVCTQAGANRAICEQCMSQDKIWTGLGCIPFGETVQTVRALMTIGLGISGTVVILTILYGSFMLSISGGDLKRVQEARDAITSAVMGLMFVIFSVTLLRFLGVNLLQLPAFG